MHVGLAVWWGEELETCGEDTPKRFVSKLLAERPPLVVIESFSLRSPRWTNAQSKQAIATIKLIGGVEALMGTWGGVVVEQQPSVRNVAISSPYWNRLQVVGSVPPNSHARSAVAHGLYYLRFVKR